jgi:hypothetical protein
MELKGVPYDTDDSSNHEMTLALLVAQGVSKQGHVTGGTNKSTHKFKGDSKRHNMASLITKNFNP